jgi:hypothetical protein
MQVLQTQIFYLQHGPQRIIESRVCHWNDAPLFVDSRRPVSGSYLEYPEYQYTDTVPPIGSIINRPKVPRRPFRCITANADDRPPRICSTHSGGGQ